MYKRKLLFFLFVLGIAIANNINAQNKSLTLDEQRRFDNYFYEAMNAKALNKYDATFDYLNYCLAIDSTNANVLFEIGNFYNSSDEKSKAMDYFQKALNYDSENMYYNLAYGALCYEFKHFDEAITIYNRLLQKYPDNNELYIYLSESYRMQGDVVNAIATLDKLEQNIGMNEKISLQKYQLYTLNKQEGKAFAEIQKYIDKYPTELKYQILLGDLYLQAGKKNDAFITYTKAKAIDPEDPYLIVSMAEYYEQMGNQPAAESEMKTALISPKMDVDTKLAVLTQYVGSLYQNRKETATANALFDTLMIQHPQEPKLNLMYGNLLLLQDKKNDARFQFQIFAEANPTNPMGWEQMIATTFPDSLNATIDICQQAISYIPDQPQFYFYLGASEYLNKSYQQALDALREGVQYVPEDNVALLSQFYGQIGDLLYHFEKPDSAFIEYDKALKYNPNNLMVLNNYSYYLSLEKKNLDKAEKMSSMTVKAEPSNPTFLDTYGWVLFEQGAFVMAKIYIENAIRYSEEQKQDVSAEVLEHYGDVLYKTDEQEKAVEYWIKAKDAQEKPSFEGRKSKNLDRKIETKTYIAE